MTSTSTGRTSPRRERRVRELDLLRFLAALLVVGYHLTARNPIGRGGWDGSPVPLFPHLSQVTRYGYIGVELFFVISGFVILLSLWDRRPGDFVVARIVRLFPAYWCCVLLTSAVLVLLPVRGKSIGARQVLANLTMLQNGLDVPAVDGVYWTLWVEMRFYALACLLAVLGTTYRRCLTFLGGWTFLSVIATETGDDLLDTLLLPHWSPCFIAGMALYLVHRFGSNLLCWAIVAANAGIAVTQVPRRVGSARDIVDGAVSTRVGVVLILGVFLLLSLVATGRLAWLRWRGLGTLGALTYPLYLLHEWIGWALVARLYPRFPAPVVLAGVTVGVLLLAYAVHRCVERPLGALLRSRLSGSLAAVRATDPARPSLPPLVLPDRAGVQPVPAQSRGPVGT